MTPELETIEITIMPKCIVSGCSNHTGRKNNIAKGIILHSFPNNPLIIKCWLAQIDQDFGDIESFAQKVLEGKKTDNFRICSEHFSLDSYRHTKKKKILKDSAIPSQFHRKPQSSETCSAPLIKVEKCVVMKDASTYTDNYRDVKDANTTTSTLYGVQHANVQGSRRQFSAGPSPVLRMSSMEDHNTYMTDRILSLTLEIMFLLTGEDYTIVKNTCVDHKSSSSSPTESRVRSVAKESDPIPTSEKKEILQLANQIIQLLTEEVPARCQDVAVYLSIEEWDYVEKHKNLYKNIIVDDQLSSQDEKPFLTPKHEIEDDFIEEPLKDLNPTSIESETGGDCVSSDLSKQNPMSAAIMGRGDGIGTAQKSFPFSGCGHLPVLTPKHEIEVKIEDDFIEEPLNCLNPTAIMSPTRGDCVSSELSKQDATSAAIMGRGIVQEPLPCSERGKLPILTPKPEIEVEIEDDFTEKPLYNMNTTARKPPTDGDCVSSELSKQEPMSAASTDRGEGIGPAQEPLSCSECGKCFKFRSRLLAHDCIHTGEKPYSCSECGKCFKFRSRVIAHERVHTGEKPFSCSECGKCFIRKSQLVQHTKIHTRAEQCSFCGKCFTQKSKLIQHERIHTGERPFFCHQCGQCFAQEATLMKHELIHTGEKPFSCSECGKRFMLKSYLRCHQRTHTGEKPFSCSYCHKVFTQKSHLSEHIKIHTGAKLFSCSECDKSFTQRSGLILHQRLHTGEKPFSCSECGKSFIKKAQLVQHKRIHTGEEQCAICGKCFTHKSKLIDHQRTHTGERPFSCQQCQKSFALKTTLARHQRLHKGEKLLCCSECGKCFMQKSDLFRHQRTHTGQQPP